MSDMGERAGADFIPRVLRQAWRRWRLDNGFQAAGSLAFQTALAMVPILAVAFALLKATGQLEARSTLLAVVGRALLPSSPDAQDEIVMRLASFSDNIAAGALGSLGLVVTIAIGFNLFLNVEALWNQIWASQSRRPFLSKFLLFYASATLGPFLVGVSLWRTAALWNRGGLWNLFASWAGTVIAFSVAHRLIPVSRVRWRTALAAGTLSAAAFELAKFGFSLYLARVIGSYKSIYGALALLPLFLFWIYLGWIILLLGVELAHAIERLPQLEAADRAEQGRHLPVLNEVLGLRVLCDVGRHYASGQKALHEDAIEERYGLSEQLARQLLQRLVERDLLIQSGLTYLPARPLDRISLDEVARAFASPAATPGAEAADTPVDRLLRELEERTHQRLAGLTLADLVKDGS